MLFVFLTVTFHNSFNPMVKYDNGINSKVLIVCGRLRMLFVLLFFEISYRVFKFLLLCRLSLFMFVL